MHGNAMDFLDRLAARARLDGGAPSPLPADEFTAGVWRKVAGARALAGTVAVDARPLWALMGGAAVAAGVMLAWSLATWNALWREAAAPSFVQDLFAWI